MPFNFWAARNKKTSFFSRLKYVFGTIRAYIKCPLSLCGLELWGMRTSPFLVCPKNLAMYRQLHTNMAQYIFDNEAFEKWENETHIPESVMEEVNAIAEEYGIEVYEETIYIRNRCGEICGYTKGFEFGYTTMSYDEGPTPDYGAIMLKRIAHLGFFTAYHHEDERDEYRFACYGTHHLGYNGCTTYDSFEHWDGTEEELIEYHEDLERAREYDDYYGDYDSWY